MTFAHTSGGVELRWIEEASFNGSQTQRQLFYDGWLLRVLPGETKRTRSVNAHFGSTLPVKVKIDYCERVYEERALPTLFRITPFIAPRDLEDALAARGYESFQPTLVQVASLAQDPQVVDMPDRVAGSLSSLRHGDVVVAED